MKPAKQRQKPLIVKKTVPSGPAKEGFFHRIFGKRIQRPERGPASMARKKLPQAPPHAEQAPQPELTIDERLAAVRTDVEEKIKTVDEALVVLKDIIVELKLENEELRRDRQFFFDKMKTLLISRQEAPKSDITATDVHAAAPARNEDEGAPAEDMHADHHSDRQIQTSLDSLVDLIMKKNTVRLADAARQLRVPEKQIEEWARILEEHELIEIHYPTFGKPILKKKA